MGHAGRQVSTLGSGATDPEGPVWYLVGVFAAIGGMVVMTLSVSFILTTTSTVASGRALAGLAEALDPGEPGARDVLLPQLASVVASLNSAPFALHYSASEPSRRLPRALLRVARGAAGRADLMRAYRAVLNDLPGLEAGPELSDEAWLGRLEAWARAHDLSPGERGAGGWERVRA